MFVGLPRAMFLISYGLFSKDGLKCLKDYFVMMDKNQTLKNLIYLFFIDFLNLILVGVLVFYLLLQ